MTIWYIEQSWVDIFCFAPYIEDIMLKKRVIFTTCALSALVALGACQSLPTHQGPDFASLNNGQVKADGFETADYLSATDFLGAKWMQGELHSVDPRTYNDGYANSYKIISKDYTYVVQGTEQAKERILEIAAIKELRKIPIAFAAAGTVKDKTENLVATPIRAFQGGREKYDNAPTREDKVMMVSSGFTTVVSKLGKGVRELGVTGARIVGGVAGTKCSGTQCISKAGLDVWSGMNSIVGKHDASRRIHQQLGTDPDSENVVLQREVDRLAYTNAYSGAGYKFGLSGAGIPVLSTVVKGIGYYNNVEFVSQYEDAEKRRTIERAVLVEWGAPQDTVNTLYRNKAFTNTYRTQLVNLLGRVGNMNLRIRMVEDAANVKTRYVARSKLDIFKYLAKLDQRGELSGYIENTSMVIGVRGNNTLILPFSTDYMIWNKEIAGLVQNYAKLADSGTPYRQAQIHIIGQASPRFRAETQKLGVKLVEISK